MRCVQPLTDLAESQPSGCDSTAPSGPHVSSRHPQVTHRLEELEFADGATCLEEGRAVKSGTGPEMRRWLEEQARVYAQQVDNEVLDDLW